MKIGTLRCKLFGHLMFYWSDSDYPCPTTYCVRCGITKEELKNEAK